MVVTNKVDRIAHRSINHNGCHPGCHPGPSLRGRHREALRRGAKQRDGVSQMIEADYDGIDPNFLFHLLYAQPRIGVRGFRQKATTILWRS